MSPALAVVVIAAVILGAWGIPKLRVWRRCRCGTQYCTGCGTKRGR